MNAPSDDPVAAPNPRPPRAAPAQEWLELFYDLVFVASIVVLSAAYSKGTTWAEVGWLLLVFSMMWTTWLCTTLLLNRVRLTGPWMRTLLVGQMILVLLMALASDDSLRDSTGWVGPVFSGILVILALLYHSAARHQPRMRDELRGPTIRCLVAAAMFLPSAAFGDNWYAIVWLVGIVIVLLPGKPTAPAVEIDAHHLIHRFGEFTIIMLGESFVKVGLVATEEPLDRVDLIGLPLTFALVFAIWWLYFTDIPGDGLPSTHGRQITWMLGHFPLHLCITAVAVGMAKLLLPAHQASASTSVRYVAVPLTVIAAGLAVINWSVGTPVARRRARLDLYGAIALVLVWLVLIGVDSHDLEATAISVTAVLAVLAWRTRGIPDPSAEGVASTSPGL